MKCLISIINWNASSKTNTCLEGLAEVTKPSDFDVLLIDNGSEEKLMINELVKKKLGKRLSIQKNTRNLGFSGGHNQAAKKSIDENYDYLILLNNDVEIIDLEFIDKLIGSLENNERATLAAPTILSSASPDYIWYGGGSYNKYLASVKHNDVGKKLEVENRDIQNVTFATGCCLVVKVSDLKTLGKLFLDDYFLYWEDADLCARTLRMERQILYVPQATILHRVSSSLGIRSRIYAYYNIRNKYIFMKKNTPLALWPLSCIHTSYVILKYLGIVIVKSHSRVGDLKIILKAAIHGIFGISGKAERL